MSDEPAPLCVLYRKSGLRGERGKQPVRAEVLNWSDPGSDSGQTSPHPPLTPSLSLARSTSHSCSPQNKCVPECSNDNECSGQTPICEGGKCVENKVTQQSVITGYLSGRFTCPMISGLWSAATGQRAGTCGVNGSGCCHCPSCGNGALLKLSTSLSLWISRLPLTCVRCSIVRQGARSANVGEEAAVATPTTLGAWGRLGGKESYDLHLASGELTVATVVSISRREKLYYP